MRLIDGCTTDAPPKPLDTGKLLPSLKGPMYIPAPLLAKMTAPQSSGLFWPDGAAPAPKKPPSGKIEVTYAKLNLGYGDEFVFDYPGATDAVSEPWPLAYEFARRQLDAAILRMMGMPAALLTGQSNYSSAHSDATFFAQSNATPPRCCSEAAALVGTWVKRSAHPCLGAPPFT